MSKYYVLHFRDGEKMDFGKKCEVVDVGGGMVRFMTRDSEKTIAMVPMHAVRMIEFVEGKV